MRERPTVNSAVIAVMRPGKTAPLVSESAEWYAIELSDGSVGYVSRYYTEKVFVTAPRQPRKPVYATQLPTTPAAPAAQPERSTTAARGAESFQRSGGLAIAAGERSDRSMLGQASRLMAGAQPKAAFQYLSGFESQWAGDSGFDYLYGIAALDSGNAGDAVFALERVTQALPGFVGARMELARALFATGDRDRARREFATLLEKNPPAAVRGAIEGYIDAIDTKPEPPRPGNREFYASALAGYDSNANGAADITDFLGFSLDPRSLEQSSSFFEAQLGARVHKPLGPTLALEYQAGLSHRHNPEADFVDSSLASATAGLVATTGAGDFIVGGAAYWSGLDGGFNERSTALDLGFRGELAGDKALNVSFRAGPVSFASAQRIRDVSRFMYTLSLHQPLGDSHLSWTLLSGRDRAEDQASAYSNSRLGGRVAAVWRWGNDDLSADIGYLRIPYNGNTTFFGTDRKDKQLIAGLSLLRDNRPIRGWTFVPRLRFISNESNVAIFDYDRVELAFELRKVAR
ncbi:MAG: tetratricopeptide repeat protein [Gammaproteobacteria bacterium]|nr:tetratricopeptide repeat protein [Gammaproteobacteria bacterium]